MASSRVIWGKLDNEENKKLPDLTTLEKAVLLPLIVAIFWIGLAPNAMFEKIEPPVARILMEVKRADNAREYFGEEMFEEQTPGTLSSGGATAENFVSE